VPGAIGILKDLIRVDRTLRAATCDVFTGTWSLTTLDVADAGATRLATRTENGAWMIRGADLMHGADHIVIASDGTNIFRNESGHNIAVAGPGQHARLMPGREPPPRLPATAEEMLAELGLAVR
jgi:hypothetical protein